MEFVVKRFAVSGCDQDIACLCACLCTTSIAFRFPTSWSRVLIAELIVFYTVTRLLCDAVVYYRMHKIPTLAPVRSHLWSFMWNLVDRCGQLCEISLIVVANYVKFHGLLWSVMRNLIDHCVQFCELPWTVVVNCVKSHWPLWPVTRNLT
jgi:hypothetical protein